MRDLAEPTAPTRSSGEAGPTEWRTPPLWGVADSAPYLHDGRASTLDEAIRLHGGEAEATSERYRKLDGRDRRELLSFLQSLGDRGTEPPPTATRRVSTSFCRSRLRPAIPRCAHRAEMFPRQHLVEWA